MGHLRQLHLMQWPGLEHRAEMHLPGLNIPAGPVLEVYHSEPTASMTSLLHCLQSSG